MQSSYIYHYIHMMQNIRQKNHKFEILMENSRYYFHFASFWQWPETLTPPRHLLAPLVCRVHSFPPRYSIAGATVTVHQFFCILHFNFQHNKICMWFYWVICLLIQRPITMIKDSSEYFCKGNIICRVYWALQMYLKSFRYSDSIKRSVVHTWIKKK